MSAALRVKVKEKPILFSGPLIRAVLEGRKTQTRRVITDERIKVFAPGYADDRERIIGLCPYGRIGDHLWLRETHGIFSVDTGTVSVGYKARLPEGKTLDDTDGGLDVIRVNSEQHAWAYEHVDSYKWRPSIFMPRWASRITLEITNIRVERLQAITWMDIRAEGASCPTHDFQSGFCIRECGELRRAWSDGWDSLNAKRGYSCESNPLVWVIEFRKL